MDGHGKTILDAEDHESNRKWLPLLLEHARMRSILSRTGMPRWIACSMACSMPLLWTGTYPGLNGSKFLALGQTLWLDTSVIMVSAHTIDPGEGIHQRAFAWLRKPYESRELLEILRMDIPISAHQRWEQSLMIYVRG